MNASNSSGARAFRQEPIEVAIPHIEALARGLSAAAARILTLPSIVGVIGTELVRSTRDDRLVQHEADVAAGRQQIEGRPNGALRRAVGLDDEEELSDILRNRQGFRAGQYRR